MPEFNSDIRPDTLALWTFRPGISYPVRIVRVEHTIGPDGHRTVADIIFLGKRLKNIPASQLNVQVRVP